MMIRLAKERDLQEILAIYNEAILTTTAVYTYEAQTLENRQRWFQAQAEEGFPIFVYEVERKVAGFATYDHFRAWPAYKYSVEHSVYVNTLYRKRGIGTKLLDAVIESANARGYKTLIAGIDAENVNSIALHEKKGFHHVGTIQNAGYKFKHWLDLAFYQRQLVGPKQPIEQ